MNIILLQLGSALLYGLAGVCLYVMLSNRFFILLRDSRRKLPIMMTSLLVMAGGPAVFGFFAWRTPGVMVPLAILVLILAGEIRMLRIRSAYTASGPIDSTPHKVPLLTPITTTDLVTHRYEIRSPKWSGRPLRIVHITDMHVSASQPLEYYLNALKIAEQAKPDLAVFTGDFVTRPSALPMLKQILRPVARAGNLAVFGNHDYWTDPETIHTVLKASGVRLLSNETVILDIAGHRLAVSGCDYPWGPRADNLPLPQDGLLHLVLSHTPDNIYRLVRASADVVFSGHCHAGQIRIPVLGPIIVPSIYGRRFDHGHFLVNGTHLFVGSGIGAAHPPIRIYCQPDIFMVDILAEKI